MKQVQGVGRITLDYAIDQFLRHCRLKNLSPRTIEYYTEDLRYFQKITEVTYLDEITDKLYNKRFNDSYYFCSWQFYYSER